MIAPGPLEKNAHGRRRWLRRGGTVRDHFLFRTSLIGPSPKGSRRRRREDEGWMKEKTPKGSLVFALRRSITRDPFEELALYHRPQQMIAISSSESGICCRKQWLMPLDKNLCQWLSESKFSRTEIRRIILKIIVNFSIISFRPYFVFAIFHVKVYRATIACSHII